MENDPAYKATITHTVEAFLQKYMKSIYLVKENHPNQSKHIKQLCSDFILEECIAMTLWSELQCRFEACSTLHNSAAEETRKRFIKTNHPNLLTHLLIGFKKTQKKQDLQAHE